MTQEQPDRPRIRTIHVVFVLAGLAGIYYLALQIGDVHRTLGLLATSSWLWMAGAAAMVVAAIGCAAWIQYLAGDKLGRLKDLLALVLAGQLFDHFLPFSLGGVGLTTAYYAKYRQPKTRAVLMASSPVVVGALAALVLLVLLSPATVVQLIHTVGSRLSSPVVVYGAAGVVAAAMALLVIFRTRIRRRISDTITTLKGLRGQRQIIAVAGWSLVRSLLAATTLYFSIFAVHGAASFYAVVTVFLLSLFVSEVTPTPGGIGATEAVLVVGLTGIGLDTAHAVAATLIYRLVSFVLPIIPGIMVMAVAKRLVENDT